MMVKDLIRKLQKFPPDSNLHCLFESSKWAHIASVDFMDPEAIEMWTKREFTIAPDDVVIDVFKD